MTNPDDDFGVLSMIPPYESFTLETSAELLAGYDAGPIHFRQDGRRVMIPVEHVQALARNWLAHHYNYQTAAEDESEGKFWRSVSTLLAMGILTALAYTIIR